MKAALASQDVLLIDPKRWAAQVAEVSEASLPHSFTNDEDEDCDIYGDCLPQMTVGEDGIAIVPIKGTISTGLPAIASAFGFVDTGKIREQIETALADPKVRAVLLNFDSPGGFVTGTPELGSYIAEAAQKKPIYSYTAGLCCSAAYWLAAPTRAIFATISAEVGSIGVYVAHTDQSAMASMMGLAVRVFRSGKYKGAGVPGTALSDDQASNIQQRVDSLAAIFKSHVLSNRPGVSEDAMQGQTFLGYESAFAKLSDAVVVDLAGAKKIMLADLT